MKKYLLTIIALLLIGATTFAQTPQSFNYQAVLRSPSGQVMANQEVEIGVAILQGSDTGTEVFAETHSVTTNEFGLVNLQIGAVNTSEMQTINWSAGPYFVQISVDGTVMGTSQLLSVPFAMHAVTVENDAVDDNDADPVNEIQVLSINADTIYLSSGGFVVLPPETDPAFTNWDKSSGIAISESQISDLKRFSADSITGNENAFEGWDKNADDDFTTADETDPVFSNSVAAAITATDTARWASNNDIQNELQNLKLENQQLSISGGNTIDLSEAYYIADSSATNELQDITLNGTQLSISKGSTVDLTEVQDGDKQRLSLGVSNQHEIRLNISNANYVEMPFVKDGVSKYNWSEAENYVAKWGQYGVMEESTIFDNGNIGIGTVNPSAKLEVAGQVKITGGEPGADKILVSDADGLASWKPYIDVDTANVYNTSVVLNGTDLEVTDGGGTLIADLSSLADSGKWEIAGNNIYNANSGNVGIGRTNPKNKLDVNGSISLTESPGNDMIIKNSNHWQHGAGNQRFGDGGRHFLMASREGSYESAGIYGDGDNVTIWSPGDGVYGQPAAYLYILDEDKFDSVDEDPYNNGALIAYVATDGIWQISDSTKKENIIKIDKAVDKINRINGYSYKFKNNSREIARSQKQESSSGILAQELELVLPEAVQTNGAGKKYVNYSSVVPLLIEGIKEQQTMMDNLIKENETLKEQNSEIEQRLETLEALVKNTLNTIATEKASAQK